MTNMQTDFISTVQEYCAWVESAPAPEIDEAKKAISLLAALYHQALNLSATDTEEDIEAERISDDEWKQVYKRFGALPFNYYVSVFSPSKIDEEKPQTLGDLADDLADIYRDLKAGLNLFNRGYTREAVWEWKLHFNIHWGRHASSALYALHCYIADTGETGIEI
jgi:Domain of unknown function (DUF5063)